MDYEELLKILEIDSPQEFTFFEQIAEIVECESYIPLDTLTHFFPETDKDSLIELIEGYFEDILKCVPDSQTEFYTLLTMIGQALSGLAQSEDRDEGMAHFSEEFYKFRNWYSIESEVHCVDVVDGKTLDIPVAQALTLYRSERITGEEYRYDFSEALDYPIDEYIMPLDALDTDEDDYSDNDERWTEDI